MAQIYHQDNFGTNLTSNTNAGDTTSPLNSIPSISAPFYLAFDATNINGNYEVLQISSKTATNVLHSALANPHTTAEEVRMVCPAEEMDTWSAALGAYTTGAWASWSPTIPGLTIGNGSIVAKYAQVGKTVLFRITITLGSTSSISGSLGTISAPVTSGDYVQGFLEYHDASPDVRYVGSLVDFVPVIHDASSAILRVVTITSTNPVTIASGDVIYIHGFYEAA